MNPNESPPPSERPAYAPESLLSARRKRRRERELLAAESEAAAEFGTSQSRGRMHPLVLLPGAVILITLAVAVIVIVQRKPSPSPAAAGTEDLPEKWTGSLPAETADAFLKATTHAERMRWVRSPQLVEPLVAAFFRDGPGSRETYSTHASLPLPVPVAGQPVHEVARYAVMMADTGKRLLSILSTPEGARIDFHTYSRHTSVPWPDLLEGRAERAEVRVFVATGSFHAAPFENTAEWLPVLGLCPDVPNDLLLYVRRGTPECAAVEAVLSEGARQSLPQRATVTLAPLQDSWQRRQFQITAFHHTEWYGPAETPPPAR